jgi:hypothetical protein
MRTYRNLFLLLLMLLQYSLIACDDSDPYASNDGNPTAGYGDDDPLGNEPIDLPNAGVMGGSMMPDMMIPIAKSSKELRIQGQANYSVSFGEELEISVQYLEVTTANMEIALSSQPVTMRLLDSTGADRTENGIANSRLQSSMSNTNADGIATFRFFAGNAEAGMRLEASAPDADPVYYNITVVQPSSGQLKVQLTYNRQFGRYEYLQIPKARISLFTPSANRSCESIRNDAARLIGATLQLPDINGFNDQNNTVTQDDFMHGTRYLVASTLYSSTDNAVAFGCSEAVIQGGQEVLVNLMMEDLPLSFKGVLTTINRFDLLDLLESSDDPALQTTSDVLNIIRLIGSNDSSRGNELIRLFCDLITDDQDNICNILGAIGGPVINGLLEEYLPPSVVGPLTVISDVLTIASSMTIIGEINFPDNYPDENNMLRGDQNWQRFSFVWRNNCPFPTPQECERSFTIGTLTQPGTAVEGEFNSLVDQSTLRIGEHGLNFSYGLIALGLAENWLFPALIGENTPVSLRDLLSNLLADFCIEVDTLANNNNNLCQNVIVGALAGVVQDQISDLNFDPDQFKIYGYATLDDENLDLRVDRLLDGIWSAKIERDSNSNPLRFNGCFVGCYEEEDSTCDTVLVDCQIPDFDPDQNLVPDMMAEN